MSMWAADTNFHAFRDEEGMLLAQPYKNINVKLILNCNGLLKNNIKRHFLCEATQDRSQSFALPTKRMNNSGGKAGSPFRNSGMPHPLEATGSLEAPQPRLPRA